MSALIEGRGPVTLVLDTGADRTMVSPAALERVGVQTPGGLRDRISGVTGSSVADPLLGRPLVRVQARISVAAGRSRGYISCDHDPSHGPPRRP